MDKNYINLFIELTRATEVAAEQVMEYDKEKGDTKGFETAKLMRDDYAALHDKIKDKNFDGNLTKNEYAKLLAGAYIVKNNLQDKMTALKKAIQGYETDLIPKLTTIVEQGKTDEEAQKLANDNLIIDSTK